MVVIEEEEKGVKHARQLTSNQIFGFQGDVFQHPSNSSIPSSRDNNAQEAGYLSCQSQSWSDEEHRQEHH